MNPQQRDDFPDKDPIASNPEQWFNHGLQALLDKKLASSQHNDDLLTGLESDYESDEEEEESDSDSDSDSW